MATYYNDFTAYFIPRDLNVYQRFMLDQITTMLYGFLKFLLFIIDDVSPVYIIMVKMFLIRVKIYAYDW